MTTINIVLVEPEIPQNTGNIARTCAATGAALHMIRPFGFELDDKKMKRAGLDYWDKLEVYYYDNLEDFFGKHPECDMWLFSTKSQRCFTDVAYEKPTFLFFGKETKGLPEDFILRNIDRAVRIPMRPTLRSLNLGNSVAIAVYEVLRQHNYENLDTVSEYFGGENQI